VGYKSEDIVRAIRDRRTDAGVSQRALSARSGLAQGHISQIETGALEPGLSSFIDMARALDLELVLVPRKLLPAVEGILRQTAPRQFSPEAGEAALREIARGERLINKLKTLYGSSNSLDRILEYLRFFRQVPLRDSDMAIVTNVINTLRRYQASPQAQPVVDSIAVELRALRNRLAHPPTEAPRPAYAQDDEDDDA
jgi:transcriptional regulator with XRE-family HTH domain